MSKYLRHQAAISKNSDNSADENHWLKEFEKKLVKDAVQPRKVDENLFDQINSVMNGSKSKYPSVAAAVEEMKHRSGFSTYLDKVKISEIAEKESKKTASDENQVIDKKINLTPLVIQKCPQVKHTLENYIKDTKGNLPIPAIIEKIKSIHRKDVSESKDWDEDKLLHLVSNLNLRAKTDNSALNHDTNNQDLGIMDYTDVEDSLQDNNDAFKSLMPAKF